MSKTRPAHDRFNIYHIFTLSFQFQCCAVPLISITVFRDDSEWGSMAGGG